MEHNDDLLDRIIAIENAPAKAWAEVLWTVFEYLGEMGLDNKSVGQAIDMAVQLG
jgi:hypothetical protein